MYRSQITKSLGLGLLAAFAAFGQYKAVTAGAPPPEVPAPFTAVLEKEGAKITDAGGKAIAEIWLVSSFKKGPASQEPSVTLPEVPHGTLLGVLRAPATYNDRRGQVIKPGIYTLRYSIFPTNGDHQGAAPQRDFFILTRLADDTDPAATPTYETLMEWSKKAAGTPHPLCLSIWKADEPTPGLTQHGESDWVLNRKAGDTLLSIILIGRAAG